MGAKTPTKLKLRRPTYKCEECDKKFLSAQALKTHKYCIHKMKVKTKPKGKLTNLLGKSVKPAQMADPDEAPQVSDVRKIEYECPQCVSRFAVYFSAFRHIQKYHCVNSKGKKVPSTSSDIIKPIRIETCIKCNMRIRESDSHSCPGATSLLMPLGQACLCLGCGQTFPGVSLFDMHVQGLHSAGVETLFFPNILTFTQWKEQMESQTGIKYLILSMCGFKQTYRCTHASEPQDGVERLCPSSIVVKEYTKSVQVHFYKQHYGHTCHYELPERFKKFLSTEVMKRKPFGDDQDLYTKLKYTLDNIVAGCFNSNEEIIKALLVKAMEMEKIMQELKQKQIENKTDDKNESVDSSEVNKDEESLRNKRGRKLKSPEPSEEKEKEVGVPLEAKKIKRDAEIEAKADKDSEGTKEAPLSTFNDSYKVFVDQITEKQKALKKNDEEKDKQVRNRKKYVKTKIGQFKPNILSPKKDTQVLKEVNDIDEDESFTTFNFDPDSVKNKLEIKYEVIEQEDDCNILVLKM